MARPAIRMAGPGAMALIADPAARQPIEITINLRCPSTEPSAGNNPLLIVPTITVAIVIQLSADREACSDAPIWPSSVKTIRNAVVATRMPTLTTGSSSRSRQLPRARTGESTDSALAATGRA